MGPEFGEMPQQKTNGCDEKHDIRNEYPAPIDIVGHPTTEEQPDGARQVQHDRDAHQRLTTLRFRKKKVEAPPPPHRERRPEKPLPRPPYQHLLDVGGEGAP